MVVASVGCPRFTSFKHSCSASIWSAGRKDFRTRSPVRSLTSLAGRQLAGACLQYPAQRFRCELTRVCALRLIAIMLGRLEMSVESCIAAYTKLMESVFGERSTPVDWTLDVKGRYSSQALETAVKSLLPEHEGPDTALLNDKRSERRPCRAYVTSHRCVGRELTKAPALSALFKRATHNLSDFAATTAMLL